MNRKYLILNFILCFTGFSFFFSLFCSILFWSWLKGIVLGCTAGLLFGTFMTIFAVVETIKFKKIKKELEQNMTIIYDDGANHLVSKDAAGCEAQSSYKRLYGCANRFVKREAVGGYLFLTSDMLYFISHRYNVNVHEIKIPYIKIQNVTKGKFPRSITLWLKDGRTESFVVNNREEWVKRFMEEILR